MDVHRDGHEAYVVRTPMCAGRRGVGRRWRTWARAAARAVEEEVVEEEEVVLEVLWGFEAQDGPVGLGLLASGRGDEDLLDAWWSVEVCVSGMAAAVVGGGCAMAGSDEPSSLGMKKLSGADWICRRDKTWACL
jgi:hypothetical protein